MLGDERGEPDALTAPTTTTATIHYGCGGDEGELAVTRIRTHETSTFSILALDAHNVGALQDARESSRHRPQEVVVVVLHLHAVQLRRGLGPAVGGPRAYVLEMPLLQRVAQVFRHQVGWVSRSVDLFKP